TTGVSAYVGLGMGLAQGDGPRKKKRTTTKEYVKRIVKKRKHKHKKHNKSKEKEQKNSQQKNIEDDGLDPLWTPPFINDLHHQVYAVEFSDCIFVVCQEGFLICILMAFGAYVIMFLT
ncbi:hypothetical protein ACJX0J_005324, partial [Zea mays]